MVQNIIAGMKARTGRTLEEWVAHVRKKGPVAEPEQRDWLKSQGLGTNYASWIAERANGRGEEDGDPAAYLKAAVKYVDDLYAGGRAALRPIHDALIELGRSLGADVKICPCKTIVPLYRDHVFAEIKPATQKRIDFGLALGAMKSRGRLEETGGYAKKDRITHRIAISSLDDIDDEVERWLRTAYEMDGPGAATMKASATKSKTASDRKSSPAGASKKRSGKARR